MRALEQFRLKFQVTLATWFRVQRKVVARQYPSLVPIFDVGAEFTLRKNSKRVRPYLIALAYRMCGGKQPRSIERLAVVAELIQSHLLIHDDIIDRDEVRRDGPTAHVALRPFAEHKHDRVHYGESQAILLGSLFGIWSRQLVHEAGFSEAITVALLEKLEEMLAITHYGQMLDVQLGERDHASIADIEEVYRSKTARYTLIGPLQLGAIAAGASTEDLAALYKFGEPFGIAFQMLNDLHGVFPDAKHLDNTGTSDIAEGKKTLLFAYGVQRLRGRDRARLQKLLQSRSASPVVARNVRTLLEKSGARAQCSSQAELLMKQGFDVLTQHPKFGRKEVLLLHELATFVVEQLR